jgi:hypothetical protein
MPTLTHNLPGLQTMLFETAQSHCRNINQEATVAIRRYLADCEGTEHLPEELVKQAYGRPAERLGVPAFDIEQDLFDKLRASALRHERTPESEAAWAILWYIHTTRASKSGPEATPGQEGSTAQEQAADRTETST